MSAFQLIVSCKILPDVVLQRGGQTYHFRARTMMNIAVEAKIKSRKDDVTTAAMTTAAMSFSMPEKKGKIWNSNCGGLW